MLIGKKVIIVTFFLLSSMAKTQSIDWENYGYAKYLFSISENDLLSKNELLDHQIHLRLNNRLYLYDYYTLGLELRLRGFNGSLVENRSISPSTVITSYEYNDMDALLLNQKSYLA